MIKCRVIQICVKETRKSLNSTASLDRWGNYPPVVFPVHSSALFFSYEKVIIGVG